MAAPYIGTVIIGSCSGSFASGSVGATLTIVTTGTYLFTFSIAVNNVVSSAGGNLAGTNKPTNVNNNFPATNLGQATFYVVGSAVVPQATGTYNLNIGANIGGTLSGAGNDFGFFNAVRIG